MSAVIDQPGNKATLPPQRRGPGRPTLSDETLLLRTLDLFLENGFDGTSMDAIAATVGVAKRTLYQRFDDKETLFRSALGRAIESWIVPVEELLALEEEDFEATLLLIGQRLVRNIMQPAGLRLLRISNAESARHPEIGTFTYQQGTQRTLDYLADLFARRLGSPARPGMWAEAANAFLYLVVTGPPTMAIWGTQFDAAALDRHTAFSVGLFLRGVPREPAAQSGPDLRR